KSEKLKLEMKHFLSTLILEEAEERLTNWDAALKENLDQAQIHSLLKQQAYQLLPWQEGLKQINYRRFFNIAELVALRVENPAVFEATHELVFRLIDEGKVTGLRVDHIDGLFDPKAYLEKLRARSGKVYVVVEKILLGEEKLPLDWPVEGTTGYEFLNEVNGIFVDPAGLTALKRRYRRHFVDEGDSFKTVAYEKKRKIINRLFKAELKRLETALRELAAEQEAPPFPSGETTRAIQEVTAALPVYRTYINSFSVSTIDRQYIKSAVDEARRRGQSRVDVLDFLEAVLLLNFPPQTDLSQKKKWLHFVMKWQQFTGPVAAKGVEDTALYVYNPLASLNEVGGEPDIAVSLKEFHALNEIRAKSWPRGLNASTTHDTKRSEDVRARLNVLSELADEWQAAWQDWHSMNRSFRCRVKGKAVPERNMELLLYTSLLGAWPLSEKEEETFQERIEEFMIKAAREGKIFTSWTTPDLEYEEALLQFVRNLFASAEFLQKLKAFQGNLAFYGMLNSLSQLVLKITCPGIPDFYQGTELWNLSLVDPDNRRPVDFRRCRQILREVLERGRTDQLDLAREWLNNWRDGRIKLLLTYICLSYRKREPALFLGGYEPLQAEGEHQESICAFLRRTEDKSLIVIAPRWWTRILSPGQLTFPEGCWKDTRIHLLEDLPSRWKNVLTCGELEREAVDSGSLIVDRVLRELPVALLEG
ncbi:MAG TPA: malto-oligosyltrehalose synthase, partial [Acidobacteriota bacterium]|nr:malto-oligosyltrehalose synthase [Acidobacteriota bacterium]